MKGIAPLETSEARPETRRPPRPLVFVVVALGVVLVLELLARGRGAAPDTGDDALLVARACDLGAGSCIATLEEGVSAELTLSPRPIPLAKPLDARLVLRGASPERAELRVRSTTMSMGTTRFRFEREGDGWVAAQQLPVCVSGTMVWIASLRLDGEDVAHFRFETRTP